MYEAINSLFKTRHLLGTDDRNHRMNRRYYERSHLGKATMRVKLTFYLCTKAIHSISEWSVYKKKEFNKGLEIFCIFISNGNEEIRTRIRITWEISNRFGSHLIEEFVFNDLSQKAVQSFHRSFGSITGCFGQPVFRTTLFESGSAGSHSATNQSSAT